jgi:CrcB protein
VDRILATLLVAAGGALGAVARYAVAAWFTGRYGTRFPWGTFAINASGCLAIGFVLTILEERLPGSRAWRPLVVIGFLGAYTTFSTFGWESHALLRDGEWERASAYLLASVALGLVAVRLGVVAARAWA